MHQKLLALSAKVALTLAALWFVFRGVDVEHLSDIWYRQNHAMLAVAKQHVSGAAADRTLRCGGAAHSKIGTRQLRL